MSAPNSSLRYLLTVHPSKGTVQKRIWDGKSPLALGFPFRWVLERTDSGIRVRTLGGKIGAAYSGGVQEVPQSKLKQEFELEVDGGTLKFHPVHQHAAVFAAPLASAAASELNVYFCLQNCVVGTYRLRDAYKAKIQGKKVFQVTRSADGVKLQSAVDGVEMISREGASALPKGNPVQLPAAQLAGMSIHWGSFYWFVRPVAVPSLPASVRTWVSDSETQWFRKAMGVGISALAMFLLIVALWPKPDPKKEEELIPPQFAKILLAKPKAQAAETPASASATPDTQKEANATKKVVKAKNAAVVQAFRAKALQNAVSGLLKGGMTHLLSESEMLMGSDSSKQARRMLDGKSINGLPAAPVTGLTNARNVEVSTMGGTATPGAVGYGKGQKAGVSGQGKSFVSLDLGNASVEEGLTKDEVGKVIHDHMSEIRYCYESSMVRNAELEGKLMLDFVIGPNGLVKTADVKESTLGDPRLDDCVIRRLTKWQFPKPKGGVNVSVSYPFIFKTLGR